MNYSDKKKFQRIYEKYSDNDLIEAALLPKEQYQEGVYDLIIMICKNRRLEEKINQKRRKIEKEKQELKKEQELIESAGSYDFYQLSTIISKIKDLSDEELIFVLNEEKSETIKGIIHEELEKRGIDEDLILQNKVQQDRFRKIDPLKSLKEGCLFLLLDSNMYILFVIILISRLLIELNGNIKLLSAFIIPPFISGIIIKYISEEKKERFSWKEIFYFVLNKYFSLAVAYLIYFALSLIGVILLIIPGIFIGIKLIFFSQIIILKNKGIADGLKGSWKVTTGNFWRLLILDVVLFGAYFIFGRIANMFPNSTSIGLSAILDAAFQILINSTYTFAFLQLSSNNQLLGSVKIQNL